MHYALGDVHGCFDQMMHMIHKIETKDPDAIFIFVGDFIDRGPKVWETMQWCWSHMSDEGKYQAVRGNHEDMVIEWYYDEYLPWCRETEKNNGIPLRDMPRTIYDFCDVAEKHGFLSPEGLRPWIETMDTMPYFKEMTLELSDGTLQKYIIVHAYMNRETLDAIHAGEDPEKYKDTILYSREHVFGMTDIPDIVLVHGHTPTLTAFYTEYGEESESGQIGHRRNMVNVDAGCVFAEQFLHHPLTLWAYCLETGEEISCT
ncbi:MAG: metallophosphoesterase [Lachnospiraceae bacterium]|nr:metallophosphoesterase [Lachnospiraceae bacterium]